VYGLTLEERLRILSLRYRLPSGSAAALGRLLRVLEDAQDAPTAITDVDRAIDAHLADSLVATDLESVRGAWSIADLGAGAGFPGLPLAAALPAARVWLVESAARKCAFLERVIAEAGIANAVVVGARVEEWESGHEACDLVVARALAALPVVVEYAAPLLRRDGTLVAWKGRRDPGEEAAGALAADQLGLEPVEVRPVRPYAGALHRHLHVFRKRQPTPPGFPRRPGMAAKRPLGARK
jgi:16S rRNA (guanine527-N7)-methyltransferase